MTECDGTFLNKALRNFIRPAHAASMTGFIAQDLLTSPAIDVYPLRTIQGREHRPERGP